ncbi:hypothetical protein Tco_1578320 [Tanacetum coccineum]
MLIRQAAQVSIKNSNVYGIVRCYFLKLINDILFIIAELDVETSFSLRKLNRAPFQSMSTDQRTSQRKLLSYVHGPTINPVFGKADGVATRLCYAIVICVPNKQCGSSINGLNGCFVPTRDMTTVKRTAFFFLNSFEERLMAQRKERELATLELGFKQPLSKEEKIEKKKQRLTAIGITKK